MVITSFATLRQLARLVTPAPVSKNSPDEIGTVFLFVLESVLSAQFFASATFYAFSFVFS